MQPEIDLLNVADTKPPRCAMCRTRMELTHREVDASNVERLTFGCPKCQFVKMKLGGDAAQTRQRRAPLKTRSPPSKR